jgi:hypothetical protein
LLGALFYEVCQGFIIFSLFFLYPFCIQDLGYRHIRVLIYRGCWIRMCVVYMCTRKYFMWPMKLRDLVVWNFIS